MDKREENPRLSKQVPFILIKISRLVFKFTLEIKGKFTCILIYASIAPFASLAPFVALTTPH